jgi:hypothetical protein
MKEKLQIDQVPLYVTRLGKPTPSKRRLVIVKMKCFEDKLNVLKQAKRLSGSGMFVMEDLSKHEREERRSLVNVLILFHIS